MEIPGVANIYLLKAAVNAQRLHRGEPELDAVDFLALVKGKLALMGMDTSLLYRAVNEALGLIDSTVEQMTGVGRPLCVTATVPFASLWLGPRLSRFTRLSS